ncbi:MAG: PKD domain-containing protein, partial [Cytophagales bacterium]|nr:PKD domain-containing protein [Cytophagales bacterium]
MRQLYFYSLLMVLLLGGRAGWAQNYTANFTTAPDASCTLAVGCESFQVTLDGVVYVFAFAPDNGGGSFKHLSTGGVGNGPSMDLRSRTFNVLTTERVTITRLDGGLFNAASLYVDNLDGKPVTLQAFMGASPVGNAQIVPTDGKQTVSFGGSSVNSIQITSTDFFRTSLDDFTVCVPPTVSLSKGLACPGQPTQFTATSSDVSPGAQYLWDFNNDGTTDATTTTNTTTNLYPSPGSYTAKVTVLQGGCQGSATIPVSIVARATAVLTGGGPVCAADSATVSIALTGTGPWVVSYSNGPTTFITSGI